MTEAEMNDAEAVLKHIEEIREALERLEQRIKGYNGINDTSGPKQGVEEGLCQNQ